MAKNSDKRESAPAPAQGRRLDLPALESWLWEGACIIRGPLDALKFKDYLLPLIFVKRLSEGRLRQFDIVTANPLWNQKFASTTYENDTYERFKSLLHQLMTGKVRVNALELPAMNEGRP